MLTLTEINIIKENFQLFRITQKQINKFQKNFNQIYSKIETIVSLNTNFESIKNYIYLIIHNKTLNKCKTCGKELTFKQTIIKQQIFCSYKCSNNNDFLKNLRLEHTKETCLKEFGVNSYSKIPEINNKKRTTFLQHYKTKKQKNALKEKRKLGSLKKYHTEYPTQSMNVRLKLKNIAKTLNYKQRQEKSNLTSLKRYGFNHKQIALSYKNILKLPNVKPMFTKEEFEGKNKLYLFQCLICGNIFETKYDNGILTRKCKCQKLSGSSQQERLLADFCKQYFPNLLTNNKEFIKPKQLDIIIPELKLAIEFNGLYWHNLENKPLGYHLEKLNLVEEKGYRLIQIWEHDWLFKQKEIKQHLIDIFENKEKIPNSEYLDRDWFTAPKDVEIIKPEIEELYFNNMELSIERTGYFKNNKEIL